MWVRVEVNEVVNDRGTSSVGGGLERRWHYSCARLRVAVQSRTGRQPTEPISEYGPVQSRSTFIEFNCKWVGSIHGFTSHRRDASESEHVKRDEAGTRRGAEGKGWWIAGGHSSGTGTFNIQPQLSYVS